MARVKTKVLQMKNIIRRKRGQKTPILAECDDLVERVRYAFEPVTTILQPHEYGLCESEHNPIERIRNAGY